jgi:hypothetical protein
VRKQIDSDYMAEVLVRDPLALQLSEEAQQEAMGSLAPKIMPEQKSAQDSCQFAAKGELFALVWELETKQLVAEGLLSPAGRTSVEYSLINEAQPGETSSLLL